MARPSVIALILAVLLVLVIDALTNSINTSTGAGDFQFYITMTEGGILGNPALVAPFAYRVLTPTLAALLHSVFNLSTEDAYRALVIPALIIQLVSIYLLAAHFGAGTRSSLLIMGIAAFSYYQVKYLLFDPFRPDPLAYPLLTLAMLSLFRRQYVLCLLLSAIGMLTREFLILPPLLVLLVSGADALRGSPRALTLCLSALTAIGVCLGLPRLLIPVADQAIYAELFTTNPQPLDSFTLPLLSLRRNLNLLFVLLSYLLPLLVLVNQDRLRAAWSDLSEERAPLIAYTLGVLGLTLYGGTDLARFVTYLTIPQTVILAVVLRRGIPFIQTGLVLLLLLVYNRIPWPIPSDDYNAFLDFYGGYHDRINMAIIARWQELVVVLFLGIGVRGLMTIHARQKFKDTSPPAAPL